MRIKIIGGVILAIVVAAAVWALRGQEEADEPESKPPSESIASPMPGEPPILDYRKEADGSPASSDAAASSGADSTDLADKDSWSGTGDWSAEADAAGAADNPASGTGTGDRGPRDESLAEGTFSSGDGRSLRFGGRGEQAEDDDPMRTRVTFGQPLPPRTSSDNEPPAEAPAMTPAMPERDYQEIATRPDASRYGDGAISAGQETRPQEDAFGAGGSFDAPEDPAAGDARSSYPSTGFGEAGSGYPSTSGSSGTYPSVAPTGPNSAPGYVPPRYPRTSAGGSSAPTGGYPSTGPMGGMNPYGSQAPTGGPTYAPSSPTGPASYPSTSQPTDDRPRYERSGSSIY
jgi:hypothetical protein